MTVTPQMTARWVKASFLILLAIVMLMYADHLVEDLEANFSDELDISFEWTWDLLRYLLWIFIAWLFVDAVLIIVLSFRSDAYTLSDVMERLERIEESQRSSEKELPSESDYEEEEIEEADDFEMEDEGAPPPP
jgi:hypothetical protein